MAHRTFKHAPTFFMNLSAKPSRFAASKAAPKPVDRRAFFEEPKPVDRRVFFETLALCAMVTLGGCVTDDAPTPPQLAAPAEFTNGGSGETGGLDAWVSGFASQELARLVAGARADNLDVAAAVARIAQADAQARVAAAPLVPRLGAETVGDSSLTPGTTYRATPPFAPSRQSYFGPAVSASYEVDFWGKNRDGASAAERLADASRYDKAVVEIAAVSTVANTYFEMLAAQDRLKIVHENVRTASEVLAAVKSRVAAGTASDGFDSAQQESVLATQRAAAPPLEITIAQSRIAIVVLLGQVPEGFGLKGGSLASLRVPRLSPGLPASVLLRRPDVAEAEARLVAQGFTVAQARAAMLPSIVLTGQGGLESMVLKNLFSPSAIAYSVAAGLTQPIFDGGALAGNLDLQKGVYLELAQGARKQTLTALSDVEKALVAMRRSSEEVALQEASVAAARRVLVASIERLRQGTIDIVSVSTTETALFQAKDALAQARLAQFQASVALYQALGGGWSRPNEKT